MAFPVDLLTNVDHESLELAAEKYMSQLHCRNPKYLSLPDSSPIEIRDVSFLPLYGTETKWKLLALLSPDDCTTRLYLLDRWWGVQDVLKTAEPSRTGLIRVSTLGERIVLYVLNRIVLRNEKSSDDISFLCHCEHESAKILWKDGEAIGFYSFKPKGSLCRNFLTQCYQLPVMDTVFVRKCHRGKGHGVKMLEDFVSSFRKEDIGLKFPLSEAMYKVCEKYFSINPADKELLWEAEKIGSPFQRTLIASRLQRLQLKEKDQVVSKLNFEEDVATSPMEIEITKIQETTEYTMEIVEKTITDITKEADDIPVTRRGRGSNLKRRGIRDNSEERLSKNIIRVEDIEAGVESPAEVPNDENLDNRFSVKESEAVLRQSTTDTVTATVIHISELTGVQKEEENRTERHMITATSEKTSYCHLTSAEEIKIQRASEEESEVVCEEQTVELKETTIGSIDQMQLQSVVDVEIVKMSTGTEEEQNESLQTNKEAEEDKIKQMLTEPGGEKAVSETVEAHISTEALEDVKEVAEQADVHAKPTELEQAHKDVEKTGEKEKAEDEMLEECGIDLSEEHRNDSMLCTEEHLSEVEPTKKNEDIVIEKAKEEKLVLDEEEQAFPQSKLPQKRTSASTPSRRSKRLRHEPAETDLKTTKFVKTTQQRHKHHSKTVMEEDFEQPINEPEHDISEVIEKNLLENLTEARAEEYKGNDKLTVETVATMDFEITQVDVVPEVSELERAEIHQEEQPQQSSVNHGEAQHLMHEETMENTVTMSEARVVLVDLHQFSSKEVGDKHGEMDIAEQEETIRNEEQDITLDNKTMEKPACTTTTEGYNVTADINITIEQSSGYKEGDVHEHEESHLKKTEMISVTEERAEKTETETCLESLKEILSTDVELTADVDTKSSLQTGVDVDYQEEEIQIVAGSEKEISLVEAEPDEEVEKEDGTPVIKLQNATVVLEDLNQLSKNTNKESETPDVLTHSQTEQQQELNEADKREQELCNLASEVDEKQEKLQEEKIPEAEKIEEENTDEVQHKLDKDMAFEEQKPTDVQSEDEGVSSLTQEKAAQEETLVSTERSLRRRTIQVQSVPKRKSRRVQKQQVEDFEDKTEKVTITGKGVEEKHNKCAEIDLKDTASKKSTVDATGEIIPLVEAEPEAQRAAEEINKVESMETTEIGEKAKLQQYGSEPEKAEPEKSNQIYAVEETVTEETVNVCIPIITAETSLETLDETQNTNVVETPAVKPDTSEDKKEAPQIAENAPFEEAEPEEEVEKDNGFSVIQLQKATVVLVDVNKLSQNTEEESDAVEVLPQTEENPELDQQVQQKEDTEKTPEEDKMEEGNAVEDQNEHDKQEVTYEGQKLTEDLQGQNDATETETVEDYRAVTSGDHLEGTTMAEKTTVIQKAEKDQDVALKEQQTDSDVEMSGLVQEVPETVQEISEEETAVSTERILRRRTIQVQATPQRKSRRVQKQQIDAFEEQMVPMMGKGVEEIHKEGAEIDDKEETLQKPTAEAAEDVIALVEAEPEECVAEKLVPEINKLENKELNLVEYTDEEAHEKGEDDSKQQKNEQLVKNVIEIAETEKHIETDPVVSKEEPHVVERTTLHAEDVFQVKMIETSQSDHKGDTRRSLRLSAKPVTFTPKTRKSPRLHKTELEPVKGSDMNINEYEETSATSEKIVEVCAPIITVETSLKSLNETANINVEGAPAVEPETSELQMVGEIDDTKEAPQIVEDVPFEEAEPVEVVEQDDGTSVIQLQKATVVLVDVNKLSQNTEEESDTVEVLPQTEENPELDQPVNSEHQLCSLISEEEEKQEVQQKVDTGKTPEEDKMEEGNGVEDQNEHDKQEVTYEGQKLTEDLQGHNDATDTETVEDYRAVTSGDHPEGSTMAEKTIIQEAEKDQDVAFKEQQTDSDVEMTDLVQEVPETVQEISEEETVSTERSLRRRTIQVQATPKRKSRRVQKQQVDAFEEKTVAIPGKGVKEIHKACAEIYEKETLQTSIVETCLESLDEMSSTNTEKTADVDNMSSLQTGVDVDYQEEEIQIVAGSEKEISLVEAEPDEEVEKEDCTPVIKLQKATVVLEDLNQLSKNTDKESETPDVLTHSQTEQHQELNEADKREQELCNLASEVDEKQEKLQEEKIPEAEKIEEENTDEEQHKLDKDMAFEEQKPTDVQSEDEGVSSLTQEKAAQEETLVSTERSLRRRTIQVQSVPKRKSRCVQKQQVENFEDKTGKVTITGKGVTETHECCEKIDHTPAVDATEDEIPLVEAEPDHDVAEKPLEEIRAIENKEIDLGNEMAREEVNVEQKENESLVETEKESAETEKPTEMDEVTVVSKNQTCIIEETTIQVDEEVSQTESSETENNENKSERITRRSLKVGTQLVPSTQKTRQSTRLHTAELKLVKEAVMTRNEDTSSTIEDAMNVCVPIITEDTNVENLNEDGDLTSVSRKEETASDEQNVDMANNKGMVDEALLDRSTDKEDNETESPMKTTENESAMDKSQTVVEEAIQEKEEKTEPAQEKTQDKGDDQIRTDSAEEDTTQQEVESQEENVEDTNPMNEFKTPAGAGKVALERSDQEPLFKTRRSLRSRTVTVQATPRKKPKRLTRHESEKETRDNICGDENDSATSQSPIQKENEGLNTEESNAELENLEEKAQQDVVILSSEEVKETEAKYDSLEERNEILPEIMESNNASLENTEQSKTQEENIEREDVQEHEVEEVSCSKDKTLQERENEDAEEDSSDLEETAMERRSLRKRTALEASAPRKSKRLRKQEQDKDSEQIKEAEMGETESVEVTFAVGNVQLRSDVPENSSLGEKILQEAQKNAEEIRSDVNILEDTETNAGESQEEQKGNRVNTIQTDKDSEEENKKAEGTGEMVEEVKEQHVETEEQKLESNECFSLELEAEETSDQEENKAMEAPKEIISEKSEEGEENISDDDATEMHGLQKGSSTTSTRRKSMRLQLHELEKKLEKDESDSEESEVQQTPKQRYKRKRKAINDSTSSRRSKRHGRAKIV